MFASTTVSPVATLAVVSTAEFAIAEAAKPGANNGMLLKAIWSTRGNIYAPLAGFEFDVAIVKSGLVADLKALSATDTAPFLLAPRADGGATLVPVAK